MPSRTPLRKPRNGATLGTLGKLGVTPTRAGDNFVSSTDLGHTQKEIKTFLWSRILRNEPGITTHLIKPHLVDSDLVAAIERAVGQNTELKALLFESGVPDKQMCISMVGPVLATVESPFLMSDQALLRHISTFNLQHKPGDGSPS
jgi:hypothetical protein